MKRLAMLTLVLLVLVGCGPSEADMAAAVAQTVEAMVTNTPEATNTPKATSTPKATNTPEATSTPKTYPVLTEDERGDMVYWKDELGGWASLEYLDGKNMDLNAWVNIDPEGELDDLELFYIYTDDDWLFIRSFVINADGERYHLDLCYESTDVLSGGSIMESVAACLDLSDEEMVKQIVGADKVMFRLAGSEGSHDFELTDLEKTSIGYAFQTFANLKEGTIEIKEGIKDGEEIWWK